MWHLTILLSWTQRYFSRSRRLDGKRRYLCRGGGSPIYSGLRKPEPCTALGTCTQYFVAQELNEFMQRAVHSSRCLTPLFSGRRCQRGPPPVTAAGRAPGQPRALHFIRQQPTVSLRSEVRPLPETELAGLGWLATQRFQTEVGHKDLPNQWEKRVSPSPPPKYLRPHSVTRTVPCATPGDTFAAISLCDTASKLNELEKKKQRKRINVNKYNCFGL